MNNIERLTPEERAEVITRYFSINRSTFTVATYKDGSKYYGFFDPQDDSNELRLENKFRFVKANNAIAYRNERNPQAKKQYTDVIDCNKLVDLRMIHANIPGEIEVVVPGLDEYLSGRTKMTYREYLEELHKDSVDKMGLYIKAEKELSNASGFFDKSLFDRSVIAKKNWQNAHNKYLDMLSFIKNNNINPDGIF